MAHQQPVAQQPVLFVPSDLQRQELQPFLGKAMVIEQHYLLISGFGPPYVPGQYFVLNLKTNVETSLSATFNCPLMMDASQCSEHGPLEIWPH